MQLLQPQEVEVFYILPAIRKGLSLALKERGQTQAEIAAVLGVTPAAVSQYLHDKRAHTTFPKELLDAIRDAASRIDGKESMLRETQTLLKRMKDTKIICELHAKLADVPHGCDVCFKR